MAKLGKGSVLHVLNRTRLQELIDRFDLDRPSRAKKDDLVNILTRSRRASLEDLIATLRRDELKAICRAHDLDDTGRAKRDLIDRILNQWFDARRCRACKTLGDFNSIGSLGGSLRKKVDSFLVVARTETSSDDVSEVWQCPACKTHYQYRNYWVHMSRTYEQYASGHGEELFEHTESLERISSRQAKEIIDRQKSPLPRKTASSWRDSRKSTESREKISAQQAKKILRNKISGSRDFRHRRYHDLKTSAKMGLDLSEILFELRLTLEEVDDYLNKAAASALALHHVHREEWSDLEALLSHEHREVRYGAIETIFERLPDFPPALVSSCLRLLTDPDAKNRNLASSALLKVALQGDPLEELQELLAAAVSNRNKRVRDNLAKGALIIALDREDDEGVRALIEHPIPRIRWSAVRAFGLAAGHQRDLSGWIGRVAGALDDAHKKVRSSAKGVLKEILSKNPLETVRRRVARSLLDVFEEGGGPPRELQEAVEEARTWLEENGEAGEIATCPENEEWMERSSTHPERNGYARYMVAKKRPLDPELFASKLQDHARFLAGAGKALKRISWTIHGDRTSVYFPMLQADGAVLEKRHLQANLERTRLEGLALRGVRLPYANLFGVRCEGQDLSKSDLRGSLMTDGFYSGTDFRGAKLSGVDLSRSDLVGCDFRKANLKGVDLQNCDLTGADLRGAKLDGARFPGVLADDLRMSGQGEATDLWFLLTGEPVAGVALEGGRSAVLEAVEERLKDKEERALRIRVYHLFRTGVLDPMDSQWCLLYSLTQEVLGLIPSVQEVEARWLEFKEAEFGIWSEPIERKKIEAWLEWTECSLDEINLLAFLGAGFGDPLANQILEVLGTDKQTPAPWEASLPAEPTDPAPPEEGAVEPRDLTPADRRLLDACEAVSEEEDPFANIREESVGSLTPRDKLRRIRLALEAGADPNARDVDQKTPIFSCCRAAEIRMLVAAGANPNARDEDGKTPLIFQTGSNGRYTTLRVLIEEGAYPNLAGSDGMTALLRAVESAEVAQVRVLLEMGADCFAIDSRGRSVRSLALAGGDSRVWDALVEARGEDFRLTMEEEAAIVEAEKKVKALELQVREALENGSRWSGKDKERWREIAFDRSAGQFVLTEGNILDAHGYGSGNRSAAFREISWKRALATMCDAELFWQEYGEVKVLQSVLDGLSVDSEPMSAAASRVAKMATKKKRR